MFCDNLNVYPLRPFSSFFDSKIASILLYGSEIWGLTTMPSIENVQMYACKRFFNISKMSCNDAVIGDLERYPIYVFAAKILNNLKHYILVTTDKNA